MLKNHAVLVVRSHFKIVQPHMISFLLLICYKVFSCLWKENKIQISFWTVIVLLCFFIFFKMKIVMFYVFLLEMHGYSKKFSKRHYKLKFVYNLKIIYFKLFDLILKFCLWNKTISLIIWSHLLLLLCYKKFPVVYERKTRFEFCFGQLWCYFALLWLF